MRRARLPEAYRRRLLALAALTAGAFIGACILLEAVMLYALRDYR